MCTTNQTSLHFLWKTNAGKSLTSVCSVSTLEGVEFSNRIVLKLWEAVKGGKFFYFVPSSCLVFIICPTFLALSATPAHLLCPHTQYTTSLSYWDQPLTSIFSPAYSLVQHMHSLGAAPADSRLLHRLPWFFGLNHVSLYLLAFFQMVLKVQFSTVKDIKLVIHISTK